MTTRNVETATLQAGSGVDVWQRTDEGASWEQPEGLLLP
jgi:hypothetical protein